MANLGEQLQRDYKIVSHFLPDGWHFTVCGLNANANLRKPGAITNVKTNVTCGQCRRILSRPKWRVHK